MLGLSPENLFTGRTKQGSLFQPEGTESAKSLEGGGEGKCGENSQCAPRGKEDLTEAGVIGSVWCPRKTALVVGWGPGGCDQGRAAPRPALLTHK